MQTFKVNETEIGFEIRCWQVRDELDDCGYKWSDVELTVKNEWLNYVNRGEFLCQTDILAVVKYIDAMLNNKMETSCSLDFIEPDISFAFFPAHYEYSSEQVYYRKGKMLFDCTMTFTIHFADSDGYNGETWSVELYRDDAERLFKCINSELQRHDAGLLRMTVLDRQMDTKRHIYCSVSFNEYGGTYYYRTEDYTIAIGDVVIVPVGASNREMTAIVKNIECFLEDSLPMPLDKVKVIIRKAEEDTDDELYELKKHLPIPAKVRFIGDEVRYQLACGWSCYRYCRDCPNFSSCKAKGDKCAFTHGRVYEAYFLEYWQGKRTGLHVKCNTGEVANYVPVSDFEIVEDADGVLNIKEAVVRCITDAYEDTLFDIKQGKLYSAIGKVSSFDLMNHEVLEYLVMDDSFDCCLYPSTYFEVVSDSCNILDFDNGIEVYYWK